MPTIRPVQPEDAEFLAQLGRQSYLDHYADLWHQPGLDAFLRRSFELSKLRRELRHEPNIRYFFVLSDSGQPVGFAKLKLHQWLPGLRSRNAVLLQKIYFLREAAGQGLGQQLMEYVFDYARQTGKELMWLDVLKSNTGGQRFYERLGFEKYREIPFQTDKMDVGMWVMKKEL